MKAQEIEQGKHGRPGKGTSPAGARRTLWSSRFVLAALVFLTVNYLAAAQHFGLTRAIDFPELTWTGWAIKDFLSNSQRPNVVFLGSSLMLVPIAGTDAEYLNHRLDGTQHHRSAYFDSTFKSRTACDVKSFNFALPGQMPSDAYLITDFLLRGKKKPDVIVYGVGPRDFMDNLLPSPAATDPYRYLARFGDISAIASKTMPDFWGRLNYELGRLVYFYGAKTDLSTDAGRVTQREVSLIAPLPEGAKPQPVCERRKVLPEFRPCEVAVGEAYFRPSTAEEKSKFVDNLDEYRKRYKDVRWDTFMGQMGFLADVLNVARSRGIRVVLVTMPLTDLNKSLLQKYAWDAYRESVQALADAKGASFVDLESSDQFKKSDFCDTVHLHAGGGRKFLDLLIARLANDQSVRTALGVDKPNPALAGVKKNVL